MISPNWGTFGYQAEKKKGKLSSKMGICFLTSGRVKINTHTIRC